MPSSVHQFDFYTTYSETDLYPYRYYTFSPLTGTVLDTDKITITFTYKHYSGWTNANILRINSVRVWFYDASDNYLTLEDASGYTTTSISRDSGSVVIDLSKCTNSYKNTAASISIQINTTTNGNNASGVGIAGDPPVANSDLEVPYFTLVHYTACTWNSDAACSLSSTLSSGDVTLSWSGAKAGTQNAIQSYEIQYCESSNGSSWGSWTTLRTVSSTATGDSTSVSPSSTYGNYRKFRVRTQGAAGSDYYSDWLESANVLRRDHAALAGFTDSTLTAGTSPVKALHMTELQDRVNTLRTFYGLSAYSFTTITAGTTGLSGWTAHVNQIRTAIEDICTASGKTHETWISFSVNCPRADIMQQLRNIILAL